MEDDPSQQLIQTAEQSCSSLEIPGIAESDFDSRSEDGNEEEDSSCENGSSSDSDDDLPTPASPPTKRRKVDVVDDVKEDADSPVWFEIPEWDKTTNNNFNFAPPNGSGLQADLKAKATPLDAFSVLFTTDIADYLRNAINAYAQERCAANTPAQKQSVFCNWDPVTLSEVYKFIAVVIQIGIDKPVSIRICWASEGSPSYKPWYHQMFSRTRFEAIYHSMLHYASSSPASNEIDPFINLLLEKFRNAFYPYQNLRLEEMVVGFQGHWVYNMFNPSRPKKYHIKVFGLADSATGYVLNLLNYFGQNTSYDPSIVEDEDQAVEVFETLLQPFVKGHHVFADKRYTSMKLLEALSLNCFYYTGTLDKKRKHFPKQILTENVAHVQQKYFFTHHKGTDMMCLIWRDQKAKKPVVACSTKCSSGQAVGISRRKVEEKPNMIQSYNANTKKHYRADQQTSYHSLFNRKTQKWWKKLFYFIMEITQTNAHILHTLAHGERSSLLGFKMKLVEELANLAVMTQTDVDQGRAETRQPGRPSTTIIERFVGNTHLVAHTTQDRVCQWCRRFREPGTKGKRTSFICIGCSTKPHLHPKTCFQMFHTQKDTDV